jgi:hypothetical protein
MIYRLFPTDMMGTVVFLLVMVVSIAKVNTDGMWISSGKPAQSISTAMASFVSMSVTIWRNLDYVHYDLTKPCRKFSSFCCKITMLFAGILKQQISLLIQILLIGADADIADDFLSHFASLPRKHGFRAFFATRLI